MRESLFCDTDLVLQKTFSQVGQVFCALACGCHLLRLHHHFIVCKREFVQKKNQSKCTHRFIYLPSNSSLFAAGSCTFLAMQLAARREEESVILLITIFF